MKDVYNRAVEWDSKNGRGGARFSKKSKSFLKRMAAIMKNKLPPYHCKLE